MNYQEKFVLFCKTYSGDYSSFRRLFRSIQRYNRDGIPLIVSIPREDQDVFADFFRAESIDFKYDDGISENLISEPLNGFSAGYINQQIVKLEFHRTGIAENYLCLDSDALFIRDFHLKDFLAEDRVPYTVLTDWEEPYWDSSRIHWIGQYQENIRKIQREIDFETRHIMTCSGLSILSSKVLEDFYAEYLMKKGRTLVDCLSLCPYEFSWYNLWLLKRQTIPIYPVTGLFKVFHFRDNYRESRKHLVTLEMLKSKYLGIVMNSNWTRKETGYREIRGIPLILRRFSKKIRLGIQRRMNGLWTKA